MKKGFFYSLMLLVIVQFGCKKDKEIAPVNAPIADFSYQIADSVVTFYSTSTNNPTKLTWDLGDGNTATGDTVKHAFNYGDYNVKLTAENAGGSNSIIKPISLVKKYKVIKIATMFGDMYMWLYDATPKHKANFLKLTEEGYYDSTTFHRIIKDFVIQGGDPNSKDDDKTNDGMGGPPYMIDAEIFPNIKHDYGTVGAARNNNPQKASNGSQFYIVVNKAGQHNLDGNYTVFGKIIKGMEVADKISVQPKNNLDRPDTDIKMMVSTLLKSKVEIKNEFGYDIP